MKKEGIKYLNSLNNLLFDSLYQLILQDKIDNLISNTLTNLLTVFELENCFFTLYDPQNQEIVQSKINDKFIAEYFSELKEGVLLFEQLEAGSLAIAKEYIAIPVFLKGKLIGTCVLVKDHLVRYVDPDFLLLYSQIFSYVLSNIQSTSDHSEHNKNLLEKEKLRNELLSTVSHELKTPMASILGFSELLNKQDLDSTSQKQYQSEIYKSAKRLSSLIANFLDLSRIENLGAIELNHFETTEIDWLAQEAWSSLQTINSKHQIEWQIEKDLPEISCDNEAITRVFINLFTNAIKYSPLDPKKTDREKILCKISQDKGQIQVCIQDNGIGINENELAKIFDRFYRTETAKKQFINGTGLGLWICQEIIKAHKGKLWCDSKIDGGTSFYLTLPLGNN